ncbi:hypothetical protein KP509_34G056600 [Ceratopteris richardii]|uniref:Major facilitator superfamily (MFS) profile domain-containing protein n=2 Tax=Ceratopteris richardii TaxID=49495 RepID=A0A8T2QKA7_CERRI|nr:hypothetical protein KP509_34G056600 [Ceratopteris richardii]
MELAGCVPCSSTASCSFSSSRIPDRSCASLQHLQSPLCEGYTSTWSSSLSSFRRSPNILASDGSFLLRLRSSLKFSASAASDASVPFEASDIDSPLREVLAEDDLQLSSTAPLFASQRIRVGALVAIAMALCNADRVIMSVAIVKFSEVYNWSTSFAGIVQSSFLWGYMLSPIVGGALVDHYGGKTVMAYGLALWSLATYLTPLAAKQSLWMLFGVRMLMGIAEGVAMPCMNNVVSRWFPRSERARAIGVTMAGFHLGSVIGLVATPLFIGIWGVDMPFLVFGLAGFLSLYLWMSFVSNDPQDHPFIKKSELHYIQNSRVGVVKGVLMPKNSGKEALLSLSLLLRKLPSWAVIVANFTNNWGYFVLLSWMPVYFNRVYSVNLKQASWFSAIPWTMMAALGCVAGSCSDFLIDAGLNVTTVRKIMQSIGFIGPALALIAVNASPNAAVAAIWLTVAIGMSSFSQAGFLVNFQEIAPGQAGLLQGVSNTVGTMGAIVSTIGIGYFVQWLGSFQAFLTLTAAIYAISTVFWIFSASGERVI